MTLHLLLVALRGVVVLVGTFIALLSYVAYRTQGARSMLYIAVGFVFLTLGSVMEGVLLQIFHTSLDVAHLVESATTLVGLLFLVYHLGPRRGRTP